ncbi:cobaltochelatase subunit CobN [Roseimaritima sediminicola]|uniref:cobaltochelatase subunit CobN n=1 Tax=Roseimaritima sediminicola TaxID=2662066 RepID=UPI00129855F7|nr:cobaltochelatase subunit CobN [Roseimaritima sediminicola]
MMLESPLRPFVTLLFLACLLMPTQRHASAVQDAATGGVLVLHTYLTPPARIGRLREAAEDAELGLQFISLETLDAETLDECLADASLVLVDLPHASVLEGFVDRVAEPLADSAAAFVLIGDMAAIREGQPLAAGSLPEQRGVPDAWAERIRRYYRFGGRQNTRQLVRALSADTAASADDLPPAIVLPEQGLYHPDWERIETDVATALQNFADDQRPCVAIAINPGILAADDTEWLDALIAALEQQQLNAYACFGPRTNEHRFTQLTTLADASHPVVDVIINAALVFRPQQRKAELDRLGVPVLQTLPALDVDQATWRASDDGLPLENLSYYYASSELAGMIDPVLVSARDTETARLLPIPEQIEAVAAKAAALSRLRRSPPAERRVAMLVYNYPPGENNFGASFLNVPKSLVNLLATMQQAGYATRVPDEEALTADVQAALRCLYDPQRLRAVAGDHDAAFLSLEAYQQWFDRLPEATRQRIEDYWGPAADAAINTNEFTGFAIPGVRLGNVFVLPQPLRHELTAATGDELRKQRIGHRSQVPLSHQYLASYLYLRQHSDAIVHFGTHGTLEWAPGKRRALSMQDDPMLALGSLPNIYPYIMDNLGEATTAKRRGRAVMISHLPPLFRPAGFRPGLHAMHEWMHDWETVAEGPVRAELEQQLVESFVEHGLDRDLGWTPEAIADDFAGFMEVLHPFLDDIAQTAQPQGLAALGQVPPPERRFAMVMQILRKPLIEALGEDIDEVFLLDSDKVMNSRPARWLKLALQDAEAASHLDLRAVDALDESKQTSVPNRAEDQRLDPQRLLELARRAQQLEQALSQNEELEAVLAALDGRHVSSSYGGDPVRNPDSLPTGRNLYGFDPTRVPTEHAWQIGTGVLDRWLETYREQNDDAFPEKLGFTLWAGETMRHHGVMEAQILHALGVRPVWNQAGRISGLEIVPAEQLGRPRIDVLLSVTGSYRDQFPQLMHNIDRAVQMVADLQEPGNAVAAHAAALREELISAGVPADKARRQATIRVFSNQSGGYGTGVNHAAYATDLWQEQNRGGGDAEMADLFVQRMGFAYGEGLDGQAAADLFAAGLARVDAAFLSRSSHTYGVLTSDDAFAYLGGFALAARAAQAAEDASGTPPQLYVQNLRDGEEVIIDPAAGAIAKELQTRYLHPQWIRAQQAEGYSGTLQVLKAAQFLWGWQATAPQTVRDDQWQAMMDVYIRDQYDLDTQDWFAQHNEAALAQMLERMLDAVRLGYWDAEPQVQTELATAYRRARDASGLIESNAAVARFAATLAVDDAVADAAASVDQPVEISPAEAAAAVAASQPSQPVRGQRMEAVPPPATAASSPLAARLRTTTMLLGVLGLLLIGGWIQHRRLKSSS